MDETAHTPNANLNANKYVMASYPPLPSGILNVNEIEMKYDNIVSKIGITICNVIFFLFFIKSRFLFYHGITSKPVDIIKIPIDT